MSSLLSKISGLALGVLFSIQLALGASDKPADKPGKPGANLQLGDPTEIANRLLATYNGYQTYTANFREYARGNFSRGTIKFKKPNSLQVKYLQPGGESSTEIYVTRKKLYVYMKNIQTVTEQDLSLEAGDESRTGLAAVNLARLTKMYHFNFVESRESVPVFSAEDLSHFRLTDKKEIYGYHLALTPRDITQGFDNMELWVDESGDLIRSRSTTVEKRVVDLYFSDIQKNVTLSDKEFEFDIPASAQVIKNALLRQDKPAADNKR